MTAPSADNILSKAVVMRHEFIARAAYLGGLRYMDWFTGYENRLPAVNPHCRCNPWSGRASDGKLRYDKKQGRLVWEFWTWFPYIVNLNTADDPKWSVVFEVIRNAVNVDIVRRATTLIQRPVSISKDGYVDYTTPGFQFIDPSSPLSASLFEKWEAACGLNQRAESAEAPRFALSWHDDGHYIKNSMVVLSPAKLASRVFGWTDEKRIASFVKAWEAAATKQMNRKIEVEVLSGQDIVEAYRNAVGYSSCMTGDRAFLINFQAENPDKVKLLVVTDENGKQSRMLVWFEGEGEGQKVWFDRQYPPDLGLLDDAASKLWPHGKTVYRSGALATNVMKLPKDRVFPYLDSYTQYLDLDNMENLTEVYIESNTCRKTYDDLQDPDKPVRMIVARENDTGGGPFAADGCRCVHCYNEGRQDKRQRWDQMELRHPWPGETLYFICKDCAKAGEKRGDYVQAFNMPGWWHKDYVKAAFKGGKAGWVARHPAGGKYDEPLHPAQKKDWVYVDSLGYCPKSECQKNSETGRWEYVFPKGEAELKAPDPPKVEAPPVKRKVGRIQAMWEDRALYNEPQGGPGNFAILDDLEHPPAADQRVAYAAELRVRDAMARMFQNQPAPLERPNP